MNSCYCLRRPKHFAPPRCRRSSVPPMRKPRPDYRTQMQVRQRPASQSRTLSRVRAELSFASLKSLSDRVVHHATVCEKIQKKSIRWTHLALFVHGDVSTGFDNHQSPFHGLRYVHARLYFQWEFFRGQRKRSRDGAPRMKRGFSNMRERGLCDGTEGEGHRLGVLF